MPLLLVVLLISGSLPFLDFLPEWLIRPELLGKESIFWYGIMALALTYGAYYAEVTAPASRRCRAVRPRPLGRSG